MDADPTIYLLTGIMASGKSTVAQLLAERFARAVHVRGDVFRRMVVRGRAEMAPGAADEALRQLRLRYSIAAGVADAYFAAGFTVVMQDVILGPQLAEVVALLRGRPLVVVVLAPQVEVVAAREAGRAKRGYGDWTPAALDHILLHETPRIGLWIDSSAQTPAQTVDEILSRSL